MESGKAAVFDSPSNKEITSSASTVLVGVGGKETNRAGSSVGGTSLGTRGIFSSVFPPPATILGRNSLNFDALGSLRKQDSDFQVGRTEHSLAGGLDKSSGSKTQIVPDKDLSSIYSDQAVEPCFLSSSIHYGGREHYVHSSNARDSAVTKLSCKTTPQQKSAEKLWCQTGGPVICMHGMLAGDTQNIHLIFPAVSIFLASVESLSSNMHPVHVACIHGGRELDNFSIRVQRWIQFLCRLN